VKESFHGGTDCVRAEAGGDWNAGHRVCPAMGVTEQTYYSWKKKLRQWERMKSAGSSCSRRRTAD
jgi:hypothetical protein